MDLKDTNFYGIERSLNDSGWKALDTKYRKYLMVTNGDKARSHLNLLLVRSKKDT